MEADLQRFYQIDYRDRWRGGLSLRRLSVFVRYLPEDSASMTLLRDGKPAWTLEAVLLDDLRMSLTGSPKHPPQPHPLRPKLQRKVDAVKLAKARERARKRRRQLEERKKKGE